MANLYSRIDFNKKIEEVDGAEIEKTLGKHLSEILLTEQGGDPMKLYTWGAKLRKDGVLELDDTDFKTLYENVKGNQRMAVMLRAQMMIVMDDAKAKAKLPAHK